ncbi:hypothetical protein G6F24_018037 [Rhizopus arrhizus]|nr:hypothetical protein G6F24_018037 [Rhizopus arrhizus]
MFTWGVPLAEVTTVGRWLAGAPGSAAIRPGSVGACCADSGCTSPTQPSTSHSAKLIGCRVPTVRPPR